jgi:hypothetical protein
MKLNKMGCDIGYGIGKNRTVLIRYPTLRYEFAYHRADCTDPRVYTQHAMRSAVDYSASAATR